ncbi:MAG: hypothetical protein ACYDGS_03195 [Thermoleophilia bacterium]
MAAESEKYLSALHRNVFLREFSFSKNEFTPPGHSEAEFADHVIWIEDLMMVYQVKERGLDSGSADKEERWFKKKVLGEATKQVRDTLNYLCNIDEITIENQVGHRFNVGGHPLKPIKVVVHASGTNLPNKCSEVRFHPSSTVGLIHIVSLKDYFTICNTLVTPAEIVEYFLFRETITNKWPDVSLPSEEALIGQYVHGGGDIPSENFLSFFQKLKKEVDDFDIYGLLSLIGERQEDFESEYDYYKGLAEFAKLNRGELQPIKQRFDYCIEAVKKNDRVYPTRMVVPRTGCGFIFFPLHRDELEQKVGILTNYTYAAKYDQKLERQVGVSFVDLDYGKGVYINWSFANFPWHYDASMETFLERDDLLRALKSSGNRPRYEFE